MEDWITLFAIAALYAVFTVFINRTFGERKKLKKIQDDMKAFQKEYQDAIKKNDQARIKQLEVREKEFAGMMKDMMLLPFKSLIIILPTFLVLIWLLTGWFPHFTIQLPISLHINEIFALKILNPSVYGTRGYFILSAAFIGLILEAILNLIEKIRKKGPKPKTDPTPSPAMKTADQPAIIASASAQTPTKPNP